MSKIKGQALYDALMYLHNEYNWSGRKIEKILNIRPYSTTKWVQKECVPYRNKPSKAVLSLIHLLAIHKSLASIFKDPKKQLAWLHAYHPQLQRVPICIIEESTEGLVFVRQYLEYISTRG